MTFMLNGKKLTIAVSYENHQGGVNNRCVAAIYNERMVQIARGTSTKDKETAINNAKRNLMKAAW